MDGSHFDLLAKTVAGTSRRSLLGAVFGAALAAAGVRTANAAAVLRKSGEICRKNGECASGVCGPKDATGRQRCGCSTAAECPAPPQDGTCNGPICANGVCGVGLTAGGSCDDLNPCTTGDTCTDIQGGIVCVGTPVNCPPPDACHLGVCDTTDGNCQPAGPNNELPDGTDCGGGNVCTGGVCGAVACTQTAGFYGTNEGAACSSAAECCQDEPTICEDSVQCLDGAQCCHPQGGNCDFDCDCCGNLFCIGNICGGTP